MSESIESRPKRRKKSEASLFIDKIKRFRDALNLASFHEFNSDEIAILRKELGKLTETIKNKTPAEVTTGYGNDQSAILQKYLSDRKNRG